MESVMKKMDENTETGSESFKISTFEMDLSEMEEVEPIESPAVIIGKFVFVSD